MGVYFSFTNNAASAQTFGWMPGPSLSIVATDWSPEHGPEILLRGRQRKKQRPHADDDEALLLLDAEPWE